MFDTRVSYLFSATRIFYIASKANLASSKRSIPFLSIDLEKFGRLYFYI